MFSQWRALSRSQPAQSAPATISKSKAEPCWLRLSFAALILTVAKFSSGIGPVSFAEAAAASSSVSSKASRSAPASFSAVDTATLRSLGVSESQIQALITEKQYDDTNHILPVDDDVGDEEYEYETDYSDEDRANRDTQNNRENDAQWRSKKEWWKDPLAQFSGDGSEEILTPSSASFVSPSGNNKTKPLHRSNQSKNYGGEDDNVDDQKNLSKEKKTSSTVESIMPRGASALISSIARPSRSSTWVFSRLSSAVKPPSSKSLLSKSGTSISSSSPAESSELILLKVRKAIISSPPAIQFIVSFAIGKQLLNFISLKFKKRSEVDPRPYSDVEGSNHDAMNDGRDTKIKKEDNLDLKNRLEESESEEIERLEDLGFGRSIRPQLQQEEKGSEDDDDLNTYRTPLDTETGKKGKGTHDMRLHGLSRLWNNRNGRNKKQYGHNTQQKNSESELHSLVAQNERRGFWKAGRDKERVKGSLRMKKPSTVQLQNDLLAFQERAESSETERDIIQKDYEQSQQMLQEIQKQVRILTQTNDFLKTQLRENQRVLQEAVQTERQKATEELARVRDAMVAVLERERRLMRAQVMKTSAQVRNLMIRKNQELLDGANMNEFEHDDEKEMEGEPEK